MSNDDSHWTWTLVLAALAASFAAAGLALTTLYPGAAPLLATGLLAVSLGCTAGSFWRLALRLRKLELENEGLIAELSQEFDKVNDRFRVFNDALAQPTGVKTEGSDEPRRRLTVK